MRKRRNKETRRRGNEKRRNKETKKRGNQEMKKVRNEEMKEMRNEDTKKWENEEMKETRKLRNEETRERKKQRGRRKQRNEGHEETKKARKWGNEDTNIFCWSHVLWTFMSSQNHGIHSTLAAAKPWYSRRFRTFAQPKAWYLLAAPTKSLIFSAFGVFFDPNIFLLIPDPYGPLCLAKTLVFAALLQSNVAKPWYSRNVRTFV